MATFLAIIDEENSIESVRRRIKEKYPGSYEHHSDSQVFFIRSDDIAAQIAQNIGMKGENGENDRISGAVFKLNSSYSGYTNGAIWDWLSKDDG